MALRGVARAAAAALLATSAAVAQAPPPSGFPGRAPPGPPAEILAFEAEPASIAAGESATLRWEALNTYSVAIEPGVGPVATRGTRRVTPSATTTYTLTVTGSGGSETRAVTVTVAGGGQAAAPDRREERAVPRLPNGKPDLSGVYLGGRGVRLAAPVALAPGAERYRVPPREDDLGPGASCLPPGVPAATMLPFPLQIVQRPDVVVILYEAYNLFRVVRMGARHPEDLDPTWMGHSVGRWDGDTLVVDVAGFNDKTLVSGHRHTEAMHVVERYRRVAYDAIDYEAIVEDPAVFAEPVRYGGTLVLHPEWEIGEYVCAENNKDYAELFGR
ncbi:MAG TPA: hypothetical protein VF322_07065 [Gammaproteobacteria bacterium]